VKFGASPWGRRPDLGPLDLRLVRFFSMKMTKVGTRFGEPGATRGSCSEPEVYQMKAN